MDAIQTRYFKLRSSDVVSEVIDGEAVIMDLRSGHYFSAREAAAAVWSALISGQGDSEILAGLRADFDADSDHLKKQLDRYIETLVQHALIVPESEGRAPDGGAAPSAVRGRRPFSSLELEVFHDMEELLLLDPIHDVEEEFGWPVKKPEPDGP